MTGPNPLTASAPQVIIRDLAPHDRTAAGAPRPVDAPFLFILLDRFKATLNRWERESEWW